MIMTTLNKPKLEWSQTMHQIEIKIGLPFDVIKCLKNDEKCKIILTKDDLLIFDCPFDEKYSFELQMVTGVGF